jgi:hypothetical protein
VGEYNLKKWICIPIIGIIIGELLIIYDKIFAGIGIHIINLLAIILIIIFSNLSLKTKNILQSLILLPLLRIINLSIPQLSENIYLERLIIYGFMLAPIYLIMKNQPILHKESETNLSIPLYSSQSFERVYINKPNVMLKLIIMLMIGDYIVIIPNMQTISSEVTFLIGEFLYMFLIIILLISLFVSNTKYWNEYISNSINIYSSYLLLTFIAIVIHKIMIMK